jgi:hypothetical protein
MKRGIGVKVNDATESKMLVDNKRRLCGPAKITRPTISIAKKAKATGIPSKNRTINMPKSSINTQYQSMWQ